MKGSILNDELQLKAFTLIELLIVVAIIYYTYTKIITMEEFLELINSGGPLPPVEAIDDLLFNVGAFARYGKWRLVSNGPDQKYSFWGIPQDPFNPNPLVLLGSDIPYDSTNGTISRGNILCLQKSPDGIAVQH